MPTLYLTEQGSTLHHSQGRLRVEQRGQVLWCAPLLQVDSVLVFGNVQITTTALSALMGQHAEVAFLSSHGRLKGRVTPGEIPNIPLRLRQFERHGDAAFALQIAQKLVVAKIHNSRAMVLRWKRHISDKDQRQSLHSLVRSLGRMEQSVASAHNAQQLLGMEGRAARLYFGALQMILLPGCGFFGRSRPAADGVNALLNLAYTLAGSEICAALGVCGLDPYFGFYHLSRSGRPSLALDLLEEFRASFVDRLVAAQWNLHAVKNSHFVAEPKGWRLKPETLKRFLHSYDVAVNKPFKDARDGKTVTFRKLFLIQARRLVAAVRDGADTYVPYRHR